MKNKYTVNNIFNNDGIPFNEIITKLVSSFIDQDLNMFEDINKLSSNIGYRLENN